MTAVPEALHTRFLQLLPKIKTHAQNAFRHIPCVHRREDAIQEVCCLGWKWFKRLVERGKDVPGEILIAVVAELTRYGFWHDEGPFGEPGVPCQILMRICCIDTDRV